MDTILLVATTLHGVEMVDIVDYPDCVILSSRDFFDSLDQLEEGQQIFTFIMPPETDGAYELIHSTFGIQNNELL